MRNKEWCRFLENQQDWGKKILATVMCTFHKKDVGMKRAKPHLPQYSHQKRKDFAYEDKVLKVDRRKDCIEVEFRTKGKERW